MIEAENSLYVDPAVERVDEIGTMAHIGGDLIVAAINSDTEHSGQTVVDEFNDVVAPTGWELVKKEDPKTAEEIQAEIRYESQLIHSKPYAEVIAHLLDMDTLFRRFPDLSRRFIIAERILAKDQWFPKELKVVYDGTVESARHVRLVDQKRYGKILLSLSSRQITNSVN